MKKIPLEVYFYAGGLRVMAHFLLTSENPHIFALIRAIVDTGSPTTLIGPLDLKKMRLSKLQICKMEGKEKPINIGGGKVYTKVLENANIRLADNFNFKIPIDFPIKEEDSSVQPSLLGVDFMLKTKSKLIFDPYKKEAYFEIED